MISLFYVTETLFILICVILILLILIQKGRGGGLASAFGGAGGQTAFGSKTGDVLTWATSILFAVFVLFAVLLNLIANRIDSRRNPTAIIPVATNQPVMPESPQSSLPKAPTGEPGIANKPPAMPTSSTAMPAPQISPTTAPAMTPTATMPPTTMPAMPSAEQKMQMPATVPATLP
jgi:preprotein translocase subunit SecG